ncbi:hypothetical protein F5Y07DRAFT_367102 [Xylaria sp. FL0933]|nr:hypothetical protein F5Y07DRAFT_367102 [Xylaria sp. FL0933]
MAPNFRQNTQTRRGNRSGYNDHDEFDGMSFRQLDTTTSHQIWLGTLIRLLLTDSH